MQASPITLVIGGSGKTGRRIVEQITAAGQAVRVGSRSAPTPFDWADPSGWPLALEGIDAIYIAYYPDLAVAEAPGHIAQLMADCKTAGVRKVVLLSGRGETNAEHCEQIVRDSGLAYTLIRAAWFNQNFDEGHFLGPVLEGVIALPAANVREAFIDADDIADVAVAALTDDKHNGELYELTGPELLSFDEAAHILTKSVGHDVRYQPITFDDYEAAVAEQAGPEIAALLTLIMRQTLDGRNERLGDGVQRALGREPRSFADYTHLAAASGAWRQEQVSSA